MSSDTWWHRVLLAVVGPVSERHAKLGWARFVPTLDRRRFPPPWPELKLDIPESLRSYPGIEKDEQEEARAFGRGPLYYFFTLYPENLPLFYRHGWRWVLPTLPGRVRMMSRLARRAHSEPTTEPAVSRPAARANTEKIRAEAARLGISAVGFAPFDQKYVWGGAPEIDTGTVIVCLLEQDWDETQGLPSASCERGVMLTYQSLSRRTESLATFVENLGYRAVPHSPTGNMASIPFAVQAGLGQLGMNGQLLTPWAGSRCRIILITTNASLEEGVPVDYGIPALCDKCQICARRCPSGAIPVRRAYSRGVNKHKIKPERCLPIMTVADGCAVCMKTCPVQRYGLPAVLEHYRATETILGKGTDELESYEFLGQQYAVEDHPTMTTELLNPSGWKPIDRTRTVPPQAETDLGLGGVV